MEETMNTVVCMPYRWWTQWRERVRTQGIITNNTQNDTYTV